MVVVSIEAVEVVVVAVAVVVPADTTHTTASNLQAGSCATVYS